MLLTLIQKEIMHHILSVRFVALEITTLEETFRLNRGRAAALLCSGVDNRGISEILQIGYINYRNYLQNQVNYQESLKLSAAETEEKPPDSPAPDMEVSKLANFHSFIEPTPLSVFAKGLEESLPSYLGMTRNGVKQGSTSLSEAPERAKERIGRLSALGNLDFLFVVSTVFSLLALLFTFDAVAGEREAGTLRITLANHCRVILHATA